MIDSSHSSGFFIATPGAAQPNLADGLHSPVPIPGQLGTPEKQAEEHVERPVAEPVEKQEVAAFSTTECAGYFRFKPAVDRFVTAVLMLFAVPLMLVVGAAILLLDGWPIFYRQTRVGKNGRLFRIWKFRTMCRNAEGASGAVWSSESDPRVTKLGRWLRCSHLDELPQLFNVMVGDMNLIGPRPERPEFVRELALELPFYEQRLNARPGITGLAQLRVGYDQSVASVHDKVILDLEYIRCTSFLKDVVILANTLPYVARELRERWVSDHSEPESKDGDADQSHEQNMGVSPSDISKNMAPSAYHLPQVTLKTPHSMQSRVGS